MSFQPESGTIHWKLHFNSPPERVYDALATDEGRAKYWAESAPEANGAVTFHILNYEPFSGKILSAIKPRRFSLEYFGTVVDFTLEPNGSGGTDLSLSATQVDATIRMEMTAGWVSVLMAMKAAVDHGVDLRNHDSSRAWAQGYVDN